MIHLPRYCPSCRAGLSWPVSLWTHADLATTQLRRERAAVRELAERRAMVRALVVRGMVRAGPDADGRPAGVE